MAHQDEELATAQALVGAGREAEGFEILQTLAPCNPDACLLFAICLRYGIGCDTVQPKRAFQIIVDLAHDGYLPAIVEAAILVRSTRHLTGVADFSVPRNDEQSVALLDLALQIEPNNRTALCARGLALLHGQGCKENAEAGQAFLERAVELGDIEAKCWLGRRLVFISSYTKASSKTGKSRAKGYPKPSPSRLRGKKLLVESAAAGFGHAYLNLARLYRDAREERHLRYLLDDSLDSAEMQSKSDYFDLLGGQFGAPAGYCNVAESYSTGTGSFEADFDKACELYTLSFEAGFIPAADAMGFHLEKGGEGLFSDRIDMQKALIWYERGRSKRHGASALHLGEAYDDGIGVAEDPRMAENLYLEARLYAEEASNVEVAEEAFRNLARLYLAHRVMAPDPSSELHWQDKLETAIGIDQARIRHNRVRALLAKISDSGRASLVGRRSRGSTTGDHGGASNGYASELRELVGPGSAEKLVAAYACTSNFTGINSQIPTA
jgi:TPR repeat protein